MDERFGIDAASVGNSLEVALYGSRSALALRSPESAGVAAGCSQDPNDAPADLDGLLPRHGPQGDRDFRVDDCQPRRLEVAASSVECGVGYPVCEFDLLDLCAS